MEWLAQSLRANPELALFLTLALGYAVSAVPLGTFHLEAVLGTLLAGLLIGQLNIPVPAGLPDTFFLLFLFAIGFRTGPEFFRGLRSSGISQLCLTVLLCLCALVATLAFKWMLHLDSATTAGLMAGAMTNSTSLGTATSAVAALGRSAADSRRMAESIATAYALTYPFGMGLVVWFLPTVGPWLMRVNLREVCREAEKAQPMTASRGSAAYRDLAARAYRLPAHLDGSAAATVEGLWPRDERVVIARARRNGSVLEVDPSTRLRAGDIIAVLGHATAFVAARNPLNVEVADRELLEIPVTSADVVIGRRGVAGQSLRALSEGVTARMVFLKELRRAGRELPFAPSTTIESGDVLTVVGTEAEIARVADEVGFAEYPTLSTDLLLVAATIVVGGLIGLPAIVVGPIALSLGAPVGVLMAGLVVGYLRTVNPRFGRIPEASIGLFQSFGLAGFLALVGLQAGPGLVDALRTSGLSLLAAGLVITLLPHAVTILVGRYIVGMNPAVLLGLCAGAGTSAPSIAAIERAADSRVPTIGYGMACAVGNVLMAICGSVLILMR